MSSFNSIVRAFTSLGHDLATPLGRKVPVVDYEIVMINNKPRYPLSKFTLEQLVNVARLQVEEESEMYLELLREVKWWFEQDIDDEGEENEEGDGGSERCIETKRNDWNEKIHHHFNQWDHPKDEMRMDDLEWWRKI
nr:hypothetical protein [Tanacetum cinerariifolium]